MLARIGELRREYGRENAPFELHVFSPDAYQPDGIRRLEDLGVTDVILGFRNSYTLGKDTQPLDDKIATIRGYADAVIAKVR